MIIINKALIFLRGVAQENNLNDLMNKIVEQNTICRKADENGSQEEQTNAYHERARLIQQYIDKCQAEYTQDIEDKLIAAIANQKKLCDDAKRNRRDYERRRHNGETAADRSEATSLYYQWRTREAECDCRLGVLQETLNAVNLSKAEEGKDYVLRDSELYAVQNFLDSKHNELYDKLNQSNNDVDNYIYGNQHAVSLLIRGSNLKYIQCGDEVTGLRDAKEGLLLSATVSQDMRNIELEYIECEGGNIVVSQKIALKDITKDYLEECMQQATFITNFNKDKKEGLIRIVDNELQMCSNGTWNAVKYNIPHEDMRDVLKQHTKITQRDVLRNGTLTQQAKIPAGVAGEIPKYFTNDPLARDTFRKIHTELKKKAERQGNIVEKGNIVEQGNIVEKGKVEEQTPEKVKGGQGASQNAQRNVIVLEPIDHNHNKNVKQLNALSSNNRSNAGQGGKKINNTVRDAWVNNFQNNYNKAKKVPETTGIKINQGAATHSKAQALTNNTNVFTYAVNQSAAPKFVNKRSYVAPKGTVSRFLPPIRGNQKVEAAQHISQARQSDGRSGQNTVFSKQSQVKQQVHSKCVQQRLAQQDRQGGLTSKTGAQGTGVLPNINAQDKLSHGIGG